MADDRAPRVGGALSVASFNVLNYFTTTGSGRTSCTGGNLATDDTFNVTFDCDVRGAWDPADLRRQQTKIVTALNALDADVVGLMEIENSVVLGEQPDEALASLVGALNRAAGFRKWAFVPSSTELPATTDQDVITNALIYQPRWVRLDRPARALGAAAGAGGAFANARTPIAASFTPWSGGDPVLVVVNHLKSKGADGATGDNADRGDGQGAYNGDRVRQAQALRDWVPHGAAVRGRAGGGAGRRLQLLRRRGSPAGALRRRLRQRRSRRRVVVLVQRSGRVAGPRAAQPRSTRPAHPRGHLEHQLRASRRPWSTRPTRRRSTTTTPPMPAGPPTTTRWWWGLRRK